MTEISKINISGVTYDIVDDTAVHSAAVSQSLTSGTTVATITIDGATTTLYAPTNTDTKVTQAAVTTSAGNYPVMLGYSTATSEVTNTLNKTALLHYNPSTKLLQTGALGVTATTGYTSTVPTAAGVDGQVMFVLVD